MIGILSLLMVVCAIMICHPRKARACILFYAGGDTTDDGANMFMRTEEMNEDTNKIYYVSPAGNHVKGETVEEGTESEENEDKGLKVIIFSHLFCSGIFLVSLLGYPELALFILNHIIISLILCGLFEVLRRSIIDILRKMW